MPKAVPHPCLAMVLTCLAFGSSGQVHGDDVDWWSLRKLAAPPVPKVKEGTWAKTPIYLFVRAAQERRGFVPSLPADRRTLLRRVTYDLLGLPPTPDEIDSFVQDASPDAYERLIDRLLASPRYGERWAR